MSQSLIGQRHIYSKPTDPVKKSTIIMIRHGRASQTVITIPMLLIRPSPRVLTSSK